MVIVIRSANSGQSLKILSSSCRAFFVSLSIGIPPFCSLGTSLLYYMYACNSIRGIAKI
nr:MAG TPA: hypothetical protein [Bacteriophage sp.]